MPRGDRIGPAGAGPMTGRGAGYCTGFSVPGFINSMVGRFRGRRHAYGPYGYGRGRGYRRFAQGWPFGSVRPIAGDYNQYDPNLEVAALTREAYFLTQQLKTIENRLAKLEKRKKEDPEQ